MTRSKQQRIRCREAEVKCEETADSWERRIRKYSEIHIHQALRSRGDPTRQFCNLQGTPHITIGMLHRTRHSLCPKSCRGRSGEKIECMFKTMWTRQYAPKSAKVPKPSMHPPLLHPPYLGDEGHCEADDWSCKKRDVQRNFLFSPWLTRS